ncbi:MAG: hypothetical protein HZB99_00900 [Candidatus Harrisonbacteria bacterium]|nr:hypothetical protein [Candidatus Harrisonbacteria bacterium]
MLIGISPKSAEAAKIFFNSELGDKAGVGQVIPVDILLDTQRESINAVEMKIRYAKDLLRPVSFSDGNSLINLWVEKTNPDQEPLIFRGIVPGGYSGQGLLLRIYFETLGTGRAAVELDPILTSVLLNDGEGTAARVSLANFALDIARDYSSEKLLETDTYPPESFQPVIADDATVFGGKYFVVFATQDKGSGMDHYEVQENIKAEPEVGKWRLAGSPHHVLNDQNLESYVFVKAVDKSGNERIEIIPPKGVRYGDWGVYIYWIFVFIVLLVLITRFLKKLYNKIYR